MKFENEKIGKDVNETDSKIIDLAFKDIDKYIQRYVDLQFRRLKFVKNEKFQECIAKIFVLRQIDEMMKECRNGD